MGRQRANQVEARPYLAGMLHRASQEDFLR
eukprot:SAG31_NODE_5650_length_2404_cov_1.266811_1_plen_29_part_10